MNRTFNIADLAEWQTLLVKVLTSNSPPSIKKHQNHLINIINIIVEMPRSAALKTILIEPAAWRSQHSQLHTACALAAHEQSG